VAAARAALKAPEAGAGPLVAVALLDCGRYAGKVSASASALFPASIAVCC
jgi:hypothetical protein